MATTAILTVNYTDNQLVAYLNGAQVYNRIGGGEAINEQVVLTGNLQAGVNQLLLVCVNFGGPAHAQGSVNINGRSQDFNFDTRRDDAPQGIVTQFYYAIDNS
ncbi:hypothetical protein D9623_14350 [Azospirillum brasilense]|uniref:Uncharacterized protein n=1 Tax=Azospirillum brasilense TaxID=192 RepID=A0A0P0EXS2_AZOBR|nr:MULTISPECIES: hypothetical protein [Azospirillum]ALJ37290.1 hypothetical protein AMK58_17585 [Azospirillum brasilense]MDW7552015.1 hypothetical protein [Azospirillum brasilense]MDW7591450.1 hypothetical protein [Azospirillum brasilense]MDW7626620.1 hypothetical protein [Azospirillum brasilense]MDX5951031.1 hypothetical protein [Azospirillum brasilense]